MYFIKHSLKNIYRYKRRYIINGVFLIITSVICFSIFLIIISCATSSQKILDKMNNRYTFSLYFYDMNLQQVPVTKEKMLSYLESEYIDESILTIHKSLELKDIKRMPYTENIDYNYTDITGTKVNMIFVLEGYEIDDSDKIDEFNLDICSLSEGRMFENDDEIVINDELAKVNNLKIGDSIKSLHEDIELKIVGIYTITNNIYDISKAYSGLRGITQNDSNNDLRNLIYTSFNTVYNIVDKKIMEYDNFQYSDESYKRFYPILYINNLELLTQELLNKGIKYIDLQFPSNANIEETFKRTRALTFDRATYELIVSKLNNIISSLVVVYLIFVVLGIAIFFFTLLISLRSRNYEVAVLNAMGMHKIKILISFCIENFIFIIIVFMISIILSGLGSPIFLKMAYPELQKWFAMSISFDSLFVMQLAICILLIVLLSMMIFSIFIFKNSPLSLFAKK